MIEHVYNLLDGDADIKAAVGSIHYDRLPQGTLTGVALQRGSMTGSPVFKGAARWRSGFFRVNVLAASYLAASDNARMIRDLLDGHRDDTLAFVLLDDEADIPHNVPEGQDRPDVWGIRIDFRFGFNEPASAEA